MTSNTTTKSLEKSSKSNFLGIIISRISGLLREITMAYAFGSNSYVAAFWLGFRWAFLIRRMFCESALSVCFIPHFEKLKANNPAEALSFIKHLKKSIIKIIFAVIILIELLIYFVFIPIASSSTIVSLKISSYMLPSVFFLVLNVFNDSILQCDNKFFLSAISPTIINILWICVALGLKNIPCKTAIPILSIFLVPAFALQWLFTYPSARKIISKLQLLSRQYTINPLSKNLQILPIIKPFFYTLIGIASTQINSALDGLFANVIHPSASAFLWYAARIQQLPLALLGLTLSTALLPPLSKAFHNEKTKEYSDLLHYSLQKIFSLMMPICIGGIILSQPIVSVIYNHGLFDSTSEYQVYKCLQGYLIGLPASGIILILANMFYSQRSYKLPALISIFSISINLICNVLCAYVLHYDCVSIAVATSLATWINALVLIIIANKKNHLSILKHLSFKTFFVSVLSGLSSFYFFKYAFSCYHGMFLDYSKITQQIGLFVHHSLIFFSFLGIFSLLFRTKEPFAFIYFCIPSKKIIKPQCKK